VPLPHPTPKVLCLLILLLHPSYPTPHLLKLPHSTRASRSGGLESIGLRPHLSRPPRPPNLNSNTLPPFIRYFIPPGEEEWSSFHQEWITTSRTWLESIGLRPDLLSFDVHAPDSLAHYARACTDVMFRFPFGTQARLIPCFSHSQIGSDRDGKRAGLGDSRPRLARALRPLVYRCDVQVPIRNAGALAFCLCPSHDRKGRERERRGLDNSPP
jgi:hypothetical protein